MAFPSLSLSLSLSVCLSQKRGSINRRRKELKAVRFFRYFPKEEEEDLIARFLMSGQVR